MDLSAYPFLSGGAVKCGHWDGTVAGDYYVDEIYLDNNPDPRIAVSTSFNGLKYAKMIFSQGNKIIIEPKLRTEAQIYEISGKIVWKQEIAERSEVKMNKSGVYIVKLGDDICRVIVN